MFFNTDPRLDSLGLVDGEQRSLADWTSSLAVLWGCRGGGGLRTSGGQCTSGDRLNIVAARRETIGEW